MIRLALMLVLAGVGVAGAVGMVVRGRAAGPVSLPVLPTPPPRFPASIAGEGMVEASSEDIAVSVPVGGIVQQVRIEPGQSVRRGDVLFTLDDRVANAVLAERQASLVAAQTRLRRLRELPRPEDIAPAEARLLQARAEADDALAHLARFTALTRGAVTRDTLDHSRSQADSAQARVREAEAALAELRAGAWAPDVAVAEADCAIAQAQARSAAAQLAQCTIRAPRDGEILQCTVHAGEFVPPGASPPPVLLGSTTPLWVRVDIDELDAWRVTAHLAAEARLRGNPRMVVPLRYVRAEPLVVPKQSLTGEPGEREDARVLRVIYAFDPGDAPIHVGELLDVRIDADGTGSPAPSAAEADAVSRAPGGPEPHG